ncbi:MAG: multicopper oxidase domain-containing protein [Nitrosopumilus sp.]|uniref:multicopper oxidase domain-containing protein n=1 Tax=Nitrosopumilus sp. TaxID=2024843 RepID=UPI00246CC5F6|nr:multicopper oxidase domain-containing protein [Nitrosopumilus sp.]MDH5431411.1 multicopper oxidase domain-containing protein [Nitrosopumilus sp.]
MKRTQTMLITTVILSIALTSVFAFDFKNNNADTLDTQIPFAAEAKPGDQHNITMEAVAMPDGLYAYRMVSYNINGGDDLVGTQYSGKPSIPGPTLILTEGDEANVTLINSACENNFVDGPSHPLGVPTFSETSLLGIHVHGVHYDISDDATYSRMNMAESSGAQCGGDIEYSWIAAPGTAGAWPYHDHMFSINEVGAEELGLFGTVIINPANGKVNGLVDDQTGEVKQVNIDKIEKEFVLWMVSSETLGRSIFYGNEIDYDTSDYSGDSGIRETALWTNPNLVATDGKIYRFHVMGLGDEVHAFHLHGHRWTEDIHKKASEEDIIDVKEIVPLQRHTFLVQASDNDAADSTHDDPEGWMYHCHITDHMEQGMSGMMNVLPEYQSDDLPVIGATFTLSDEPGLWMKTLDAGIADELDNYLADKIGLQIDAKDGTGFPLGYISDALEAAVPGAGTDFSNSEGRSLAVINLGETVNFGMKDSQTKHTITTLIYPQGAELLGGNGILNAVPGLSHFDQQLGIRGSTLLTDKSGVPTGLDEPGLYVFVCKIHPYMFSAVIVDDPETNLYIEGDLNKPFPLLDLSENLVVLTRTGTGVEFGELGTTFPTVVPPTHDLAKSLLTTFYVITDPNNWRDYQQDDWNINLPPVLVTTNTEELAVALPYSTATTQFAAGVLGLTNSTGNGPTLAQIAGLEMDKVIPNPEVEDPEIDGIGEVWVNTQFETTLNKNHPGTPSDKPGTITVIDTGKWNIERKIALPEINMNHPHNMWTDTKNEVIYQTQWFGNEMAVIDRESGELIKEVFTGQSPSHVMTSPATDSIYIAVNGEETVNEFDSVTYEMTRQLSTGFRSHPHGHWVSSSGQYLVTPDFIGLKASILDLESGSAISSDNVLFGPIATGMKGDESVFYTADFLGNSMTAIDPSDGEILSNIDWLDHGLIGLPIQTPISPDDQYMVTALTLGGKIGVVDVSSSNPEDHFVTAILDCDPGCHGVQWGAKDGGGYYAYVSSKFSNVMIVVDPNPDDDVETDDAEIAGRVLLADNDADSDDRVIGYEGFGGQGVLAIPNVYEGWIQNTVDTCDVPGNGNGPCGKEIKDFLKDLTNDQQDPLD